MPLPIAYYGDPVLRKKGAEIKVFDEKLKQLVRDMEETLHAKNGIGLAAPQVHQSLALFLVCPPIRAEEGSPEKWLPGKVRVFINPKLSNPSDEMAYWNEGCLSIPGLYEDVLRPESITVEAMDEHGTPFKEDFSGFTARIIMHENDHINGVLYIDRLNKQERAALDHELREIKKKYHKK